MPVADSDQSSLSLFSIPYSKDETPEGTAGFDRNGAFAIPTLPSMPSHTHTSSCTMQVPLHRVQPLARLETHFFLFRALQAPTSRHSPQLVPPSRSRSFIILPAQPSHSS